nr:TPA_asm: ND2 [Gammarus chevreuxi]
MLIHPAFSLFLLSLTTSVIITVSANSWFVAWVGLEVNLLSFIPLMLEKKNKYSAESALKYFLIQALASILIIVSISYSEKSYLTSLMVLLALLIKSGAAPSHQWMPALVDGLSWPLMVLLMTLQKMNPLILIFFLAKTDLAHKIMALYATSSALIGALGGLSQTSLRKIIAYSSIAHLSWILATLLLNSWAWLVYFAFYAFVLISLISVLTQSQSSTLTHITTMNSSYLSFITAACALSLGGLPPFTGFLPKFMIAQQLVYSDFAILLAPLLTGTFISLFFYARVLLTSLVLASSSTSTSKTPSEVNSTLLNFNLVGLLLPSLCVIYL